MKIRDMILHEYVIAEGHLRVENRKIFEGKNFGFFAKIQENGCFAPNNTKVIIYSLYIFDYRSDGLHEYSQDKYWL